MALFVQHKDIKFGVGDKIKVIQKIKEGEKEKSQVFEGVVIAIKGANENKNITVRRIGAGQIGIERIFPLSSPTLERIDVIKSGTQGVRRAKLYYLRNKPKKELQEIYKKVLKKSKITQVLKSKISIKSRKKREKRNVSPKAS